MMEASAEAAGAALLERERAEAATQAVREVVSLAAATAAAVTERGYFRISAVCRRWGGWC
jgi:hypothetical protein